jgi:hypothetical protein
MILAPFLLWLGLFGDAAVVAMAWQTAAGAAGKRKPTPQRDLDLSSSILQSLKQRSKPGPSPVLDLVNDFYDPSTGLHSEGVWHNGMVGIASLRLHNNNNENDDEYYGAAAQRIADSLWKYSWDGTSFQRRAYSGLWDHTPLSNDATSIEQSNYYQPSKEHRCIQHGLASIFWSELVDSNMPSSSSSNNNNTSYQEDQSTRIAESFVDQFWDDKVGKWHTVSKQQGWGTVLRPSASSGQPPMGIKIRAKDIDDDEEAAAGEEEEGYYYFRAVDQAIGILACLGMLKQQQHATNTNTNTNDDASWQHNNTRKKIQGIVEQTCKSLLASSEEEGFGYGGTTTTEAEADDARTYIGLDRNRNFWHDGWPLLALTLAREYAWPSSNDDDDDSSSSSSLGQEELGRIFQRLVDRYGHLKVDDDNDKDGSSSSSTSSDWDGTVWHWERSFKPDVSSGNVRYCGDNALLYAIARNLPKDCVFPQPQSMDTVDAAFHSFIQELRSRDPAVNGLSSVADAYPQIRLHPNTELAALALW